jgi:N-acetylmuramic acid 6-phosphate etherase
MVLNMISTATMVRLGYVSGNRMSNLQAKNSKLRDRALRILMQETGLDREKAEELLQSSEDNLSVALVMMRANASRDKAVEALRSTKGKVEEAAKLLAI